MRFDEKHNIFVQFHESMTKQQFKSPSNNFKPFIQKLN